MTSFAKAWLGPARTRACDTCRKRVGVSWWSMLMLIPFYAGMAATVWLWPSWSAVLPAVLGLVAMFVYHDRITPLVAREA